VRERKRNVACLVLRANLAEPAGDGTEFEGVCDPAIVLRSGKANLLVFPGISRR